MEKKAIILILIGAVVGWLYVHFLAQSKEWKSRVQEAALIGLGIVLMGFYLYPAALPFGVGMLASMGSRAVTHQLEVKES